MPQLHVHYSLQGATIILFRKVQLGTEREQSVAPFACYCVIMRVRCSTAGTNIAVLDRCAPNRVVCHGFAVGLQQRYALWLCCCSALQCLLAACTARQFDYIFLAIGWLWLRQRMSFDDLTRALLALLTLSVDCCCYVLPIMTVVNGSMQLCCMSDAATYVPKWQ
jgi:hypothetical protein